MLDTVKSALRGQPAEIARLKAEADRIEREDKANEQGTLAIKAEIVTLKEQLKSTAIGETDKQGRTLTQRIADAERELEHRWRRGEQIGRDLTQAKNAWAEAVHPSTVRSYIMAAGEVRDAALVLAKALARQNEKTEDLKKVCALLASSAKSSLPRRPDQIAFANYENEIDKAHGGKTHGVTKADPRILNLRSITVAADFESSEEARLLNHLAKL